MSNKEKIVFMGSPDFSLSTLGALHENYPVAGVVTQPDRAAGRGRELKPPPVKTLALELGIPIIQPEKLREPKAMEQLRVWAPDAIVVAAFGQILKQDVLDLPEFGCINVHASLLPRWRGAAPINAAILHGDEETGVTIMKMDAGLDTGPILSQRSVRIKTDETAGSLFETLSTLGADLLLDTLPKYFTGEIELRPQPEEGATYATMLKKEDGRLDFSRPAEELERKVRAFNPWPGTYFEWDGNLLKVHRASIGMGKMREGERGVYLGLPAVGTSENLLVLGKVQPAGKKPMPGKAFLTGARNWTE
ncbi:MAG: methionyl-tRNA formyltransferase [Anaerolineales bacterium]|jgi:methionyl-tRNA formyltransferase